MTEDDSRIIPALDWMYQQVPEAHAPLSHELIAGGRSNLTYRITATSGSSWILRRQPVGPRPPRAHDLTREFGILAALTNYSSIPVLQPIALCEDPTLLGVTFYVMEDVPGQVLRDPLQTRQFSDVARSNAARRTVETLAAVHSVDLDAPGLADLGPRRDYVGRQLRRWLSQVHQTGDREVFEILSQQQMALVLEAPVNAELTLVHGDYRFDNVVLDPSSGDVRAVIDWEIATLGDPLADLALFLVTWDQPGDERPAFGLPGPTSVPGFPTRQQALDWYVDSRPVDLTAFHFYLAFGYWRLACVLHCVSHRYQSGTGGGASSDSMPLDVANHLRWLTKRSIDELDQHRACMRSATCDY